MATLTYRTKVAGVLTAVTSVVLEDPTDAYGIKRNDTGAAVVAAGTAMSSSDTGVYTYDGSALAEGVEHTAAIKWQYAGHTGYHEVIFTPDVTSPELNLVLSEYDEVAVADVAFFLDEYGEAVTVYPPAGDPRSVTGIVTRDPQESGGERRSTRAPTRLALPNSATTGISGAEWNNRWTVGVPRTRGGAAVTMRVVKALNQDAGMITWELA